MTKTSKPIKYYSENEERLNVISHGIGLILSIIAFPFLLIRANSLDGILPLISFTVFGLSLIILYAASTFYHKSTEEKWRAKLNIFDHSAICILIAGTYTPFTLVALGKDGLWIFLTSWGFALVGVILKMFFTGKFDLISIIMYVLMGWLIVFAISPLLEKLPSEGVNWLFLGGISYTIGAVLYSIKKIPFNHAIFHLFVLGGSCCHFVSIYFYVTPVG